MRIDEVTASLSQRDALLVMREIETGRGGIAALMTKKPHLRELCQQVVSRAVGDPVRVYRAVAVLDELRADRVVSMSTDLGVVIAMARDFPVLLGRDRMVTNRPHLLCYDVPIGHVVAHVPTLAELAAEKLDLGRRIVGRRGEPIHLRTIHETGLGESEVIADVSGLSPKAVFATDQSINGSIRLSAFEKVATGRVDDVDSLMRLLQRENRTWRFDDEDVAAFAEVVAVAKRFR